MAKPASENIPAALIYTRLIGKVTPSLNTTSTGTSLGQEEYEDVKGEMSKNTRNHEEYSHPSPRGSQRCRFVSMTGLVLRISARTEV